MKHLGRALPLLLIASTASALPPSTPPVVPVDGGRVSGTMMEGVDAYRGIPYAAPPVGDRRWRAPGPVAAWRGVRAADRFGASCPQNIFGTLGPWTHEYMPAGATSEDCLTLNVWRPQGDVRRLPVLIWIHGGGFTSGSASVDIYDGAALARKGIVVVSINYRLGFFGSLAAREFRDAGGGNFGLQDQIAALRWVGRNVARFGGDPGAVTIAGQSAGGFAVHQLILSPMAKGLFQRAIPESGVGLGAGFDLWLDTREQAEKSATTLLAAAGAPTVAAARKLTYEQLAAAYRSVGGMPGSAQGFRTKPYADGVVLPLDPRAAFAAGRFNDTPVMMGLTNDEGSGLNPSYRLTDPAKYTSFLAERYGDLAPRLAAIYPITPGGASPVPRVIRDAGIAAVTAWGAERARFSRYPLYGYVWTHVEPGPESAPYGAFHTSEVPYALGTLDKAPERGFTAEDRRVSTMMQDYWANFVRAGNPNGAALPRWPVFGKDHVLMELGGTFAPYSPLDPRAALVFDARIRAGGTLF